MSKKLLFILKTTKVANLNCLLNEWLSNNYLKAFANNFIPPIYKEIEIPASELDSLATTKN